MTRDETLTNQYVNEYLNENGLVIRATVTPSAKVNSPPLRGGASGTASGSTPPGARFAAVPGDERRTRIDVEFACYADLLGQACMALVVDADDRVLADAKFEAEHDA